MRVHISSISHGSSVSPYSAAAFSRMTPEQLLRMCVNASYSPWISLMKCSVPLGRLSIALRLIISRVSERTVGYFSASSRMYFILSPSVFAVILSPPLNI